GFGSLPEAAPGDRGPGAADAAAVDAAATVRAPGPGSAAPNAPAGLDVGDGRAAGVVGVGGVPHCGGAAGVAGGGAGGAAGEADGAARGADRDGVLARCGLRGVAPRAVHP